MAHRLWSIGHIPWDIQGPFLPKSNDSKRGPTFGPPCPIFGHKSQKTTMAPKPQLAKFGLCLGTIQQSPEDIRHLFPGPSPQEKGRTFPIIGPKGCRNLEWGIYGLRYHYA
ncbi:hypothetical protein O181_003070 [Austropuccinia psidii MF-1]|uniref:Uncharacterized protein n=1 Tax=Austropuccinia psidii MF-1 TaxID=1389203 RepID=A0A9Q3BDP4_9BASI|nr:hypothetical protein [Austropuccinia psidii MF-1]